MYLYGLSGARMRKLALGSACRFFTFCRLLFSEIFTVSPSARNQVTDSCGRPLDPMVPSTPTCALSRSLCESGISGVVMPRTLRRARPVVTGGDPNLEAPPVGRWAG